RRRCTTGEVCRAGACEPPGLQACETTAPPRACLNLRPLVAKPGEPVSLETTCSSDYNHASADLRVRYDFDGDGLFDTPELPLGSVAHAYPAAGTFEPAVEVVNGTGGVAWASRLLVIAERVLTVTTGADEDDVSATPAAPGGTGLSLREAINLVNLQAEATAITFLPGLQIAG
ncbi:MAG: PKD domain-containing protein, partial [Myxococcales bacterium]